MNKTIFLFSISFLLSLLISCKEDKEAPGITINSPIENDTINISTDSILVDVLVSDNQDLHEMRVDILSSTGAELFSEHPIVHELGSYNYQGLFLPIGIVGPVKMTLNVVVADHHENVSNQSRDFYVQP